MSDLQETLRKNFCGCPTMIKTKNKQFYKQTNKHTNKYTFLDPIYLSQIKSDLHKIIRETSCRCPKMIKIKKHINQKTNKQTHKLFLDPIYLNQIKSNLHKIFGKHFYPNKLFT